MKQANKKELITYLSQFVTEERKQKIDQISQQRTRWVTIVLEDIYQPHNASACLRSCDGFGVQDVHIIENRNSFDLNRDVSLGSDRWLTLYRYSQTGINNTQLCLDKLKKKGYKIVATTPHEKEIKVEQIPVDQKLALLFGTELNGLSDEAFSQADYFVKIPMFGFCESFNISVSVALCLYEITTRLRGSETDWSLSESEKLEIQLNWLRQSIRGGTLIEQKFITELNSTPD